MLKASSPLVVSLVSWSDKPPDHDTSVLLVARNLGNVVTGGRDGSLVIWTLSNDGKFRPELLCCGHRGVIKNLCLANSLDLREKSYFVSHSSNNELALWNWGDGTCVKFKLDSRYHHIKIESYQPSFLDARLLFCCGRYPCIVVMHAMQLTPLYTLSSISQPDWIADLSVFTHSNLHQEVVLGLSASGVVTVWTLTGEELLGETSHEHESRIISVPSKILQIHCCRQFPRLVLVICTTEWRVLDAIDCSTLARCPAPLGVCLTGGAFFHKEYVAIYTNQGEVHIFRLSVEVTLKNANKQVEKPRKLATLSLPQDTSGSRFNQSRPPPTFAHVELLKPCRANLCSLGVRNAVTLFFGSGADGSLHAWCLTADLLVSEDSSVPSVQPFLSNNLVDTWLSSSESPMTNFFSVPTEAKAATPLPANSKKPVVTCCIIVYSACESHDPQPLTPLPPRLILGLESGDILVSPLTDCLTSLLSSVPIATTANVNGDLSSWTAEPRHHLSHFRLSGHSGAVLCLLHPYGFNSQITATAAGQSTSRGSGGGGTGYYAPTPFRFNILCSGGVDCSVRIWDLDTHAASYSDPMLACLGVFYCHAAPVVGLVVGPPSACRGARRCSFLSTCICSVADDGSVALLSPQDKQLVLRARTGPGGAVGVRVHAIGWRLPEMLLLLLDEDGNLTVWDAASGRLERFETGAQAEDLFQTASDIQLVTPSLSIWTPALAAHLYYRGGGCGEAGGNLLHAVPLNESAAAGAAFRTLPSSLLINRGDLKHPEAFAAPVLMQTVASYMTRFETSDRDEQVWRVHAPAAYVFHFDVEALIRNLLAMASSQSPDALNKPSDGGAPVPLGLSSCWVLTRLLLSLICPLEGVNDVDLGLIRFLRSAPCPPPGDDSRLSQRFQFACASEGGCLTLRLPSSFGPIASPPPMSPSISSHHSASIATSLYLSIMSLAEALCSLPPTRASELVTAAVDSCEPVTFLRSLALLLTRRLTADLSHHLRTPPVTADHLRAPPTGSSVEGCCPVNLCWLTSFWQAKCLQIRFAARTLVYACVDLLPMPVWHHLLSQWSDCLPQPPPPAQSHHNHHHEAAGGGSNSNPVAYTVNGGHEDGGMVAMPYPGGWDFSPRATDTPGSPSALPPQQPPPPSTASSSPPKAVATCPSLDRLLLALGLDAAFYDNFPPPPTLLPSSDPTMYNPLARRLKIGAILMLGIVGSRVSAETLLAPEVAARDLAPDEWPPPPPPPQALQVGLAAPFYGPSKPPAAASGSGDTLVDRNQKAKLFECHDLPRRVACLLENIFSYISPATTTTTTNGSDACLLNSPPPQCSPVRRAAIDILTRGFTAWEPYVDAAQFVNSLLNLCADADSTLGIFKLGSVLTEVADLARSARQGLWSLTYARPHLVVLTLSLTLRRLGPQLGNVMGAQAADKPPPAPTQATAGGGAPSAAPAPTLRVVMSSPALAAPIFTPAPNDSPGQQASPGQGGSAAAATASNMQPQLPLLRARSELICLFEGVCQRRPADLLPILPELVEVLLVCVDRIRLKERGLDITFPALQRFRNVDSHTRAQKICVGGANGSLTFFDFKTGRYFYTQAHNGSVTAVKFSSDGRQMASYSVNENRLRLWQLSTSGLFGMGGQQVKALTIHPVRPLAPPGSAPKPYHHQTDASLGCTEAALPTICLDWTEAACINILQNGQSIRQVKL